MCMNNKNRNVSIYVRIFKRIVVGIVLSLLINSFLSLSYTYVLQNLFELFEINISKYNVADIFFTELSLVFLVISFVTLLANKTESVYWVDVIQYRLIKPDYTSVVDISSYIFANLILSLVAFVFSDLDNVMITSFVITIILLGFLCIKLLISFFGKEQLKDELVRDYEAALEYRKLVYDLRCKVDINSDFDVFGKKKRYVLYNNLADFGTRHPIAGEELQRCHDSWLKTAKKRIKDGEHSAQSKMLNALLFWKML